MSKTFALAAAALMIAAPAFAQPPAAAPAASTAAPAAATAPATAPAAAKLSSKSGIKALIDNPKSKEVLAKHIPMVTEFFASGQAEAIVPGTTPLADIAQSPQAQEAGLTAETLKKIDEDLAKL